MKFFWLDFIEANIQLNYTISYLLLFEILFFFFYCFPLKSAVLIPSPPRIYNDHLLGVGRERTSWAKSILSSQQKYICLYSAYSLKYLCHYWHIFLKEGGIKKKRKGSRFIPTPQTSFVTSSKVCETGLNSQERRDTLPVQKFVSTEEPYTEARPGKLSSILATYFTSNINQFCLRFLLPSQIVQSKSQLSKSHDIFYILRKSSSPDGLPQSTSSWHK